VDRITDISYLENSGMAELRFVESKLFRFFPTAPFGRLRVREPWNRHEKSSKPSADTFMGHFRFPKIVLKIIT
jgi:hypothetical protein